MLLSHRLVGDGGIGDYNARHLSNGLWIIPMSSLLRAFALLLIASNVSALTIADFVKRPEYEQIRLSPKGDYFAAVIPYEDQNAVVIIDREKMAVTGSMRLTEGQHIGQLVWANDERIVAEILVPQSDNDQLANAGELLSLIHI